MSGFFDQFVPRAWQQDDCVIVARTAAKQRRRTTQASRAGMVVVTSSLIVAAVSIGVSASPRVDGPVAADTAVAQSESNADTADPAFWQAIAGYMKELGPRPEDADSAEPALPDVDA